MRFLDPFVRFINLRRNHFDSGWQLLTTAAHNQKWLMNTKVSHIRGLTMKHIQIEYQMIADTLAYLSVLEFCPMLKPVLKYDSSK